MNDSDQLSSNPADFDGKLPQCDYCTDNLACAACEKTVTVKPDRRGTFRLPKGWKKREALSYCGECWKSLYRLRAVSIPVAECLDGTWQEFCAALHCAWSHSTALSNWAVHQLALADKPRQSHMPKMPPLPRVDLYKLFGSYADRAAWDGAAQSANSIFHAVESRYRKARFSTLWRCEAALPTYRYPTPYVIHNAAWTATWTTEQDQTGHTTRTPTVSVPLGGRRWTLRLRGGNRRNLAAFAQVVSGAAIQGALMISRQRASGSHRQESSERKPGGGRRTSWRIMVKVVAHWPQPMTSKLREGTLLVRTTRNCFLVAGDPDTEHPWKLHDDHARGRIKQHAWQLDRLSNDLKAERRNPKRERQAIQERLDVLTHRHRCWLDTYCHTAAKMLANYADRSQVQGVSYDDTEQRYFPNFPWAKFRELLKSKLEDLGLRFTHFVASGEVAEAGNVQNQPKHDSGT